MYNINQKLVTIQLLVVCNVMILINQAIKLALQPMFVHLVYIFALFVLMGLIVPHVQQQE